MSQGRILATASLAALLAACAGTGPTSPGSSGIASDAEARCNMLANQIAEGPPVGGLKVTASVWQPRDTLAETREGSQTPLPAHCLVEGYFAEREGLVGGPYRIAFRMRLPQDWNERFFFQGGGGSNGVVGDATGPNGTGNTLALARGYAVIAQDSGHDNDRNSLPSRGGQLVFGHDPQARADYGHASLKPVYDLGQHIVSTFYGRASDTNIFWGCSKGGQEGMAFAQRYPEAFDGIVAMAPGMSLPRAAVAQAWDTQALTRIFAAREETPTVEGFRTLFSPEQITLVTEATLAACDSIDGTQDGVIAAIGQCTTARVEPRLRARECVGAANGTCLEPAQVDAMIRIMDGPYDSAGNALYASWAWDAGIGAPNWRTWKTGIPNGPPSLNILLGGGSLAAVFTTPPTALPPDPEQLLQWQLAFDFDDDAPHIYATDGDFGTSAWQDIGMRSTDLAAFRAHGGRLIVPHGTSDPVFSVLDTIAWWEGVDAATGGEAASFALVFPVPGMNHCGGGPATDHFDTLSALEDWVIDGQAPASIPASAGENTPWPGREMPLCPYPKIPLADAAGTYRCGSPLIE